MNEGLLMSFNVDHKRNAVPLHFTMKTQRGRGFEYSEQLFTPCVFKHLLSSFQTTTMRNKVNLMCCKFQSNMIPFKQCLLRFYILKIGGDLSYPSEQ